MRKVCIVMRIDCISACPSKSTLSPGIKRNASEKPLFNEPIEPPTVESVSFKGIKNALRHGGLGAVAGAIVGSIFAPGVGTLAGAALFASIVGGVGVVSGATIDDKENPFQDIIDNFKSNSQKKDS